MLTILARRVLMRAMADYRENRYFNLSEYFGNKRSFKIISIFYISKYNEVNSSSMNKCMIIILSLFLIKCPVSRDYGVANCERQGESGAIFALVQSSSTSDSTEKDYWNEQAIGLYALSKACKKTVK